MANNCSDKKLGGVTSEGSMISSLPLLFADGFPTSLDKITESQLETFIPFMINCSVGRIFHIRDSFTSKEIPIPKWWLNQVEYRFPLKKSPRNKDDWLSVLKSLVKRCYSFHDCKFMLEFCSNLSNLPRPMCKFVDLCNGTTALHNKSTSKLLVTFRNENQIYDKRQTGNSPRKYLLPRGQSKSIQPPLIDIYLCDTCDAEFETEKEVRDHERICRPEPPQQYPRVATPENHIDNEQARFLNYFQLGNDDHMPNSSCSTPARPQFKSRCRGSINFTRCCTVPFSSILGIKLQRKMQKATYISTPAHMDKIERYCLPTKPCTRDPWTHCYKSGPKRRIKKWVHKYSFSTRERLLRAATLETGLSERSRNLLKKCNRLHVVLTRLTEEKILYHTSKKKRLYDASDSIPNISEIPVIDLCSTDDELSNSRNSPLLDLEENAKWPQDINSEYGFTVQYLDSPPSNHNPLDNVLITTSTRTHWLQLPKKSNIASENRALAFTKVDKTLCYPIHAEAPQPRLQELNKIAEALSNSKHKREKWMS